MQAYYMLPTFTEAITKFAVRKKDIEAFKSKVTSAPDKSKREARKLACVELVTQLQRLFAYLTYSNRKCVDTRGVTSAVVDDFGKLVKIGEQKDVGEFNINFLARVNEALELENTDSYITTPHAPPVDPAAQKVGDKSVNLGMSILLPVRPDQLGISFIYKTFFGAFQIVTKAVDKDGTMVELRTNTTFGQIIVNATEKDLYRGWEKNYYGEVEEFQTPSVSHFLRFSLEGGGKTNNIRDM